MAEFLSSRFGGVPLLQQVLDDPDTGAVKLGPGSPADAVQPVQRALADLRWPAEAEPAIEVDGFDDGIWGDNTSRTVLTYKHVFRVVFPGGGVPIDAFVGPRTLWLLDRHIAWFDLLLSQADVLVGQLEASGSTVDVGGASKAIRQLALKRDVVVDGVAGSVFVGESGTPVLVREPILSTYLDRVRSFGSPVSEETDGPDGTREQEFEFGTLRHDPATGAVTRVDAEILPRLVF